MKETMLTYINEEVYMCRHIIANASDNLRQFAQLVAAKRPQNWLVLATGSSANAMWSAKYYVEKVAGVSLDIREPFNFVHYEDVHAETDLVVAVSQSGQSYSTIEALKKVQAHSALPTVALTAEADRPLADYADVVIDIGCGPEKVGFVTKGFTATVLTAMLSGIVSGKATGALSWEAAAAETAQLAHVTEQIPHIIDKTEEFYRMHAAELTALSRFAAIGYGPTVGTAKECETKFTETVRVPTQGFELEAYMHGPYLEVDADYGLFFINTNSPLHSRAEKLRRYLQDYTVHCFTVTSLAEPTDDKTLALAVDVAELMSPLVMAIPFQLLSYRVATGRGIDLSVRIFDDFDEVLKSKV
ncbi:SIS domain-containing protein [Numidum massiliense]|uniref:SIS domain-containing protein n=1 Tax=Numidum massiliense TaxID=1522315 RepID=UPI0006D5AB18|nr:SIS domain-containing protein [Numidum massiliense]